MRVSRAEKDRSHARIVASASQLFRERGLEGASVGDVMKEAGLTHGGFYKHFDSKDALVESAIGDAFAGFVRMLEVGRLVGGLARGMAGSAHARRSAAIREFSMLVGAMVIARASDDATAREVLAACRSERRVSSPKA